MPSTKVDWSQVRRAYDYGDGPACRLAQAFGVSTSALHRRKRIEGWSRRAAAGASVDSERTDAADDGDGPTRRLDDLNRLLERASTEVAEALASAAADQDVEGRDRALKALDLCLRAMEKIMTLRERDVNWREACEAKAVREQTLEGAANDVSLREELERRLARLAAEAGASGLPEQFERG